VISELDVSPFAILQQRLEEVARNVIALAPNLLAAIVFLLLTWLLASLLRWAIGRVLAFRKSRPALKDALQTLAGVTVWLIGILIAATIALPGLSPSEALAGIGIGSIAVGLAFRDIFENFLAGLLILLRQPMRIGDFVECQDVGGVVERITIRDTYLRRTDGVLTMLPNAFLYKNPVRVLTDKDLRRQELVVGIAYGEDVDEARQVIEKAMGQLDSVKHEKPVQVFAKDFASSSIDFEVAWWTGSRPLDVRESRDEVVAAIKSSLDRARIEIPFPYRTLVFKDQVDINVERPDKENKTTNGRARGDQS
jgi:small conductance mechanosensitive channel